jgi:hypothetical protein
MADNWNSVPLAAIGSGLVDVPQRATFADVMDPYERAAYTLRRKYGTQVPGPSELATPEEQRQAALSLVSANPVMRGIAMAPRVATGLGALGAYLYGTDQAGANEPDMVKQLQAELKAKGYYSGPIDGVMGKGTQAAKDKFDAAEALRVQRDLAEAQKAAATAAGEGARAQQAETERRAREAETRSQEREQGAERMRQMEEAVPTWRKALRDYAAPAGYVTGAVAGGALRTGLVKGANRWWQGKTSAAEELVDFAKGTPASAKVARTNEFWRRGGGEVPFVNTPKTAPGFAANPAVTPTADLYQPPRAWNAITDLGATAGFAGESAYGQLVQGAAADEELKAAREAVSADPSEANLNRLQAAKDNAAFAQLLTNFGRGGVGGYAGKAAFTRRNQPPPAMEKAEQSKLDIEKKLRPAARTTKAGKAAPADGGETLGDILSVRTTQQRLVPPYK